MFYSSDFLQINAVAWQPFSIYKKVKLFSWLIKYNDNYLHQQHEGNKTLNDKNLTFGRILRQYLSEQKTH